MRKFFFILIGIVSALPLFAQQTDISKKTKHHKQPLTLNKDGEEGVIDYHKQIAFGLKLTSDGYGVFMELGRQQSIKKSLLFQLEITERKGAKEEKVTNPDVYGPPIIYGKENFFYPIKLGVQQQILLGNKSNKNGVCVSANVGGGFVFGLLRPYEVNAIIDTFGNTKLIKYNSPDSLLFLSPGEEPYVLASDPNGRVYPAILGVVSGPGFGDGWNDLSVVPGLYAKTALRFDYGRSNELLSATEVGLTGEYYTKKIPFMVYVPEKQFFLSAYVTIMFGKRK